MEWLRLSPYRERNGDGGFFVFASERVPSSA